MSFRAIRQYCRAAASGGRHAHLHDAVAPVWHRDGGGGMSTLRATVRGDSNIANNASTVSAMTRIPTSPDMPSFMRIQSDSGDYVGSGGNYSYSNANAVFEVTATGGELTLVVNGSQRWRGSFFMPARLDQFEPGADTDLQGAPFHNTATGGLVLGQQCLWPPPGVVPGGLRPIRIGPDSRRGHPVRAALWHGHRGVAGSAALGRERCDTPPGARRPAPGRALGSCCREYAGEWQLRLPKERCGGFRRCGTHGAVHAVQRGAQRGHQSRPDRHQRDRQSQLQHQLPSHVPADAVAAGVLHPDAQRLYIGNPAVGGLSFSGDGRACNVVTGWFVIDSIAYLNGTVTALDARFEQHCEGDTPAAHGRIHWRSDDPTTPPGPVQPPPGGLWTPPAAVLPATGNVVFLQSSGANEFLGMGRSYLYTPLDSVIEVGGGGISPRATASSSPSPATRNGQDSSRR